MGGKKVLVLNLISLGGSFDRQVIAIGKPITKACCD
jgi:hypothetical protein